MGNEEHYRKLERMYLSAPVNEYYAPEIHISEGQAQVSLSPFGRISSTLRMPCTERIFQIAGRLIFFCRQLDGGRCIRLDGFL